MTQNELILIPKAEKYIQYIIEIIIKLPRTEKYLNGHIGYIKYADVYNLVNKLFYTK